MKYAIINNTSRVIENVIELNDEGDFAPTEGTYLKKDDQGLAIIGQAPDGEGKFIVPEPLDVTGADVPLTRVSQKQFRTTLSKRKLYKLVPKMIEAIPDEDERELAQIA